MSSCRNSTAILAAPKAPGLLLLALLLRRQAH
jgi:hypothetical protein